MRHYFFALSGCLALFAVSACDRGTDPGAPVAAAPADGPAIPDAAAGDSVSMRYACDGDYQVAVIGDSARVTAQDGRVIELARVSGQSPPLFAGEALKFSVTEDGAVLGQDEGGPFACAEAL